MHSNRSIIIMILSSVECINLGLSTSNKHRGRMVTLATIRVGDEFIDKGGGRERVWRKGGRRGCGGREG